MEETELPTQSCPQCQATLPVYRGYPTWCEQCGWNLQPAELPQAQSLSERLWRSLGQKSGRHLFERMVKGTSLRTRWTLTKIAAFGLAGAVHSLTLAFIVLGLWLLLLDWPHFRLALAAVPCFVVAWVLLPGVPKLSAIVLPRERFPTLYHLCERAAQALGGPPVDQIICDIYYNAAFGRFGWRQKRTLILGLPLFSMLTGPEKVGIIGHELAHSVNGDPSRSVLISTALSSLNTWYQVIHPRNRLRHVYPFPVAMVMLPLNLVSWVVAGLVWVWGYGLAILLWRDMQRAEYLADFLGAEVSGTEAYLSAMNKLYMYDVFRISLVTTYLNRDGQNFFSRLQQRAAKMPARELERIRRLEQMQGFFLGATHPPTAYRIEFLKAHYKPEAKVTLSEAELAQLEQELVPLREEMQREVFGLDSLTFRSVFGVSW